MTSKLYKWKDLTIPTYESWFGFGYELDVIDKNYKILSFFSYSNLDVQEQHTLLLLEKNEIEDIIPFNATTNKKVLWKMLLVDQNRYKQPTIIYVDPEWIEPLKPNENEFI